MSDRLYAQADCFRVSVRENGTILVSVIQPKLDAKLAAIKESDP